MTRPLRLLGLLASAGLLLGFGWLSWQVYASTGAPERFDGAWIVGPPAGALNDARSQLREQAQELAREAATRVLGRSLG